MMKNEKPTWNADLGFLGLDMLPGHRLSIEKTTFPKAFGGGAEKTIYSLYDETRPDDPRLLYRTTDAASMQDFIFRKVAQKLADDMAGFVAEKEAAIPAQPGGDAPSGTSEGVAPPDFKQAALRAIYLSGEETVVPVVIRETVSTTRRINVVVKRPGGAQGGLGIQDVAKAAACMAYLGGNTDEGPCETTSMAVAAVDLGGGKIDPSALPVPQIEDEEVEGFTVDVDDSSSSARFYEGLPVITAHVAPDSPAVYVTNKYDPARLEQNPGTLRPDTIQWGRAQGDAGKPDTRLARGNPDPQCT